MGAYDNCIILIPALQPDERMIQLMNITDGQAHPIR